MERFLSTIFRFNAVQVVGIYLKDEGFADYYLMHIKHTRSKLVVQSTAQFGDFEQLAKNLDTASPKLLLVDGKGILNKKIDYDNPEDVLWTKNLDYGVIHHVTVTAKNTFISFCRRNVLEQCIEGFQQKGFTIADAAIGPLPAVLLKESIGGDEILANETALLFSENEFTDIAKSKGREARYEIGGDTVSQWFLPLYGTALNFFLGGALLSKSDPPQVNKEELLYKKAFVTVGATALVGFLALLLLSYVGIGYYSARNVELNLENVYSNQTYQTILELEAQKENKLKILNESGSLSGKFLSFYAYECVKSVPAGIALSAVKVSPVSEAIKSNKKVSFDTKTINIFGTFQDESTFNSWIENLRKFNWNKSFEILSLKKDKKNLSHFELKIAIKDV